MKVALIDTDPSGHHAPYARDIVRGIQRAGHFAVAAGPAAWCTALDDLAGSLLVDWQPTAGMGRSRRLRAQRSFFERALRICVDAHVDVAHFLYLDGAIESLLFASIPTGIHVVATLHWYPFLGLTTRDPRQTAKAFLCLAALWGLVRRDVSVVVHSHNAQATLRRIGVHRVHAVDYPNATGAAGIDQDQRRRGRERLGVADDIRLLLCFGGTRFDKGVDLAIAALAGTDARIRLLVAGLEQDFHRGELLALARHHGVENRLLLSMGHVPECEVVPLFAAADALLLPYRPAFTGQSGPLTIAGALGVPIIASNVPVLAETLHNYALGSTFVAGDSSDLRRRLNAEWPRIDPFARRRFVAACDPQRFAARNVAIYELERPLSAAPEAPPMDAV
jgi:glycosyltransferase involved in cell wall biosynthesis